jgi:hypothetical protein
MSFVDEQGRSRPALATDEPSTLLGVLDWCRETLRWKCSGVDAAGLRQRLGPSNVTLGGMLKHLAQVENVVVGEWMVGTPAPAPFDSVDWSADPDWDWNSAADDTPEELFRIWQESVERSRARISNALEKGDLDQLGVWVSPSRGETPNLRYILVALIQEYSRHLGHVDLLREAIDGLTGE